MKVTANAQQRRGGELRITRNHIKPIYLFETSIRTWLVTTPKVLAKRFPSFNRTISLLFMYMMFQVLAILGAFLLNAICSVTLDVSGLAARHAFDFSWNVSIVHGFATFYVTYSTIRVFVRFGQAIGVIAWESLDDFPEARKIVNNAITTWPMFISIVFIPQCLMAFSLVGTPWLCKGVTAPEMVGGVYDSTGAGTLAAGLSQAFPFRLDWQSMQQAAWEEGLGSRLQGFVCTRTPLLYFTRLYPNPRRTVSAVVVMGLIQYTQILLHRFPRWRDDMRASGRGPRVYVHFSLLACLGLTGMWLMRWIGLQLGLELTWLVDWLGQKLGLNLLGFWLWTFGDTDIQEFGLYLIAGWTLWVAMLALVLCWNASSAVPKDTELRIFFQNLKTSFIVGVTFFFLRGCVSPTMGFIEAQQELTILTIVIPILYVALYTTVNAALQLSAGLLVLGGPVAMVMSVQLCRSSGFGGPGTFIVVFLHIFIKLIQLFGDESVTNPDKDGGYIEADARRASDPNTPQRFRATATTTVNAAMLAAAAAAAEPPVPAETPEVIDDSNANDGGGGSSTTGGGLRREEDWTPLPPSPRSGVTDKQVWPLRERAAMSDGVMSVDRSAADEYHRGRGPLGSSGSNRDSGWNQNSDQQQQQQPVSSADDARRSGAGEKRTETEEEEEGGGTGGSTKNGGRHDRHGRPQEEEGDGPVLNEPPRGSRITLNGVGAVRRGDYDQQRVSSPRVFRAARRQRTSHARAEGKNNYCRAATRAVSSSPLGPHLTRRRLHAALPVPLPASVGGRLGRGGSAAVTDLPDFRAVSSAGLTDHRVVDGCDAVGVGSDAIGGGSDAGRGFPGRVDGVGGSGGRGGVDLGGERKSFRAGPGCGGAGGEEKGVGSDGGGMAGAVFDGSVGTGSGDARQRRSCSSSSLRDGGVVDASGAAPEEGCAAAAAAGQQSLPVGGVSSDGSVVSATGTGGGSGGRAAWQAPAFRRGHSEGLYRLEPLGVRAVGRARTASGTGGELDTAGVVGVDDGRRAAWGGLGDGWDEEEEEGPGRGWYGGGGGGGGGSSGGSGSGGVEGGSGSAEAPCVRCCPKMRSLSVDDLFTLGNPMHEEMYYWNHRAKARYDLARRIAGGSGALFDGAEGGGRRGDGLSREGGGGGGGIGGGGASIVRTRGDGVAEPEYHRWSSSSSRSRWVRSVMDGMESNAQFVFKGAIRGAGAFVAIVCLFLASFEIIRFMQEENQWYPNLIKYSVSESKQLIVDNAFVVKATLETTGDPVIVEPRYASCGSQWHGLSLLDYALLAEIAYFDQNDPEVPLSKVAEQFFPADNEHDPGFEIKLKQGDTHNHAQFFEAYSQKLNVSVVAIRGTDVGRISDLIEDIKIWVEPIVLKGLSMVFPTIRIWPDSTSSVVIEWLHETLQLFGLQQQAHYYRPLVEYVRAIKKDRDVVLTGHSLGGGLARIVGALEKATSICFSPPGIAQSYRKFSVGASALDRAFLHQMSVSVIPEHDFVPMIDTQVGLIQLISCSTAGKALQLSCHMLEGTICDIIRHCGDDRGRFTDCKFEYNMSHLLPQLIKLLHGKLFWVGCVVVLCIIVAALVILPEFLA